MEKYIFLRFLFTFEDLGLSNLNGVSWLFRALRSAVCYSDGLLPTAFCLFLADFPICGSKPNISNAYFAILKIKQHSRFLLRIKARIFIAHIMHTSQSQYQNEKAVFLSIYSCSNVWYYPQNIFLIKEDALRSKLIMWVWTLFPKIYSSSHLRIVKQVFWRYFVAGSRRLQERDRTLWKLD